IMQVKANLKEVRQRKGLTQFELAVKCQLSLNMIQSIESNRCKSITFSTMTKICAILGCEPGELLKLEN
ncbi:MAG TPA: helix-turn-helix transcriptional regulator, partial [Allocoleopsis sp.]